MHLAGQAPAAQPGFLASDSEPPRRRWPPWRPAAKELARAAFMLVTCLRGLVHRAGSALIVLAVAVVASGAAAAGPAYYQAAQRSILTDVLTRAGTPFLSRGFEISSSRPIARSLSLLLGQMYTELDRDLGEAVATRDFQPPIASIESTGVAGHQIFPLVWRTGFCAHLVITGHCPLRTDQVIVSEPDAAATGWRIGSQIRRSGWPTFTVTGVYQLPNVKTDYWVLPAATYFAGHASGGTGHAYLDAVFTSQATLNEAPPVPSPHGAPKPRQGYVVVDDALAVRRLRLTDVDPLRRGLTAFELSQSFVSQSVSAQSSVQDSMQSAQSQWQALRRPVELATLTVLLLSWLLLFMIVTDAVEARGQEIALAKLRGHGWTGILIVGLAEPVVILLAAWPAGVLAGFAAAAQLSKLVLAPGTPNALPLTALAAAAAAVAGGLAAVIMAAQRGLRRGVVEQLRRPAVRAPGRGWVIDSILITGSVTGLIEVLSLQQAGATQQGALILLVPGVLGLAVAVVASRLLPPGCRALYGLASAYRSLAAYLALRHIARRSGGVRTTTVLATAFSMAAFAFAAWSVGQRNYQQVAQTQVGAADVLTVAVPAGQHLGAIVDKADPSGRLATAVDSYDGTLAVDPARFARIAYWPRHSPRPSVADLEPPAPPIVLTGEALRVTVDVGSMSIPHGQLQANLMTRAAPVALGYLPGRGLATLTAPLIGCPCVLKSLTLNFPGQHAASGHLLSPIQGQLTVVALAVRTHGQWISPVPARVLRTAGNWRDVTPAPLVPSLVAAGPRGLTWTMRGLRPRAEPTLAPESYPVPLPGIVAAAAHVPLRWVFDGDGLDGSAISIRVRRVLPWIPSAPATVLIVDRRYAERAADGNLTLPNLQVWLAPGALPLVEPRLIAAHVKILSMDSASAAAATIERQGPALASVLFLADATTAALLATGGAILGLYASARRRRYEYASLEASGVSRGIIRRALLIELAVVLGFGAVVGAMTGLMAAEFVLKGVPEFDLTPAQPTLSYLPSAGPIAAVLGAVTVLMFLAAFAASLTLISGVRADLLREAAE